MKKLIKNVTVLTMDEKNTVYRNGYVLTEGGRILEAGEWEDSSEKNLLQKGAEVIDGRGGILLPGLINTHCHVSMMPFRTLGDDCADRLRRFLFPLENDAMTRRLVRLAARYGICEMLLAGVTSFVDMYYFEDEVAEACEELGSIEAGKKADLVIVETDSVNMFPCYNPYSALVYSANASNVDTVMVNGELLVRGKQLVKADLQKIRRELEQEMGPFMEAAKKYGVML